jgi:type II secretory pathway component PulF
MMTNVSDASLDNSALTSDYLSRRRRGLVTGYLIVTISLAAIAAAMSRITPQFVQLFAGFGAALPWLTRFVIASTQYLALLPAIPGIIAIYVWVRSVRSRQSERALTMILVGFAVVAVVIIPISVAAFYLPIFKLSKVG